MGLLGRLVTLPLAPVQAVVWMAERLADEADRQMNDEPALRAQLAELAAANDRGEIDDAEYDAREENLLRRMQFTTHVLDDEGGR